MGIIQKVIPMLQVDDKEVLANAVTVFGVLAYNPENKKLIREQDALEPIVALLQHTDNEVLERVCGTIQNLALDGNLIEWYSWVVAENRVEFRQLDAIYPLAKLLDHNEPSVANTAASNFSFWNF